MEMEEAKKVVDELIARSKAAQNKIKDYSQEQVDRLVKICGRVIYDNAEMLAKEAVEEGGLGSVEDKIGKMRNSTSVAYQFLKDKKTVGIIGYEENGSVANVAKPIGVSFRAPTPPPPWAETECMPSNAVTPLFSPSIPELKRFPSTP